MNDTHTQGLLDYLPAIYREHPFLEAFLRPFGDVVEGFQALLAEIDRYYSPRLSDPEFLPWLATWLALLLDEEWDEAKRRRLIGEAVALYRWRGTVRGLQRYLEIYTGMTPEIREWHWPGGMQIGVASRLGGFEPGVAEIRAIRDSRQRKPIRRHDYYVVSTRDAEGRPRQVYYRSDQVLRVAVVDEEVIVEPVGAAPVSYRGTITRRDGLTDDQYRLTVENGEGETGTVDYRGDTFLVDEVEGLPYRFVVDVRVPIDELARNPDLLDKVRAIVDLEKPAHTAYYLKLSPVTSTYVLLPMVIGIDEPEFKQRSTIGVGTVIG